MIGSHFSLIFHTIVKFRERSQEKLFNKCSILAKKRRSNADLYSPKLTRIRIEDSRTSASKHSPPINRISPHHLFPRNNRPSSTQICIADGSDLSEDRNNCLSFIFTACKALLQCRFPVGVPLFEPQ